MRKPSLNRSGVRGGGVTISKSFPPPLGGLNHRDALADMKITDAIALDNWWPKTSYMEIRGGCSDHLTGMTGTPKTLAVYNKANGTSKMYAVTDAGVFDATTAGAVGSNLAARTNGKHQWLNYADGTNNYLIMCNGVDKPLYYDGTTWTAVDGTTSPALTGLTTTSIVSTFQSKGRLYFIANNSLSFWYLPAGVAGGALTEFPLEGVAQYGGYLVAGATWTFDGGDGIDDAVVLVTSEGEVIVYKGTNPSSASAWTLAGVFSLGEPLGRRCLVKFGGDLLLVTRSGVFPLSQALTSTDPSRVAVTNKIENEITADARTYGGNFGWELTKFDAQGALILNVPLVEGSTKEQYVMNTITKAWTKFTGWNGETFAVLNNELYFAMATKVVKAWTGTADFGVNIEAYSKQAFSEYGYTGVQKQFTMYKPVLNVNGNVAFSTDFDIDFKDNVMLNTATYSNATGAQWDVASWDTAYWAAGMEIVNKWTSPSANIGVFGSPKIKIATDSLTVQWMANDVCFKTGGIM